MVAVLKMILALFILPVGAPDKANTVSYLIEGRDARHTINDLLHKQKGFGQKMSDSDLKTHLKVVEDNIENLKKIDRTKLDRYSKENYKSFDQCLSENKRILMEATTKDEAISDTGIIKEVSPQKKIPNSKTGNSKQ